MPLNISLKTSDESPKITGCRFAERADLRKIGKLVRCRTLNLFPSAENLGALYEKSCLPLVQENELGEVVSAMFLCNYPNVPALSQSAWPSWMDKLYDVQNASAVNTLFVHLGVWDEVRYRQRDSLVNLLSATFYAVARCDYVVLVVPPTIEPADAVRAVMTKVAPKNESNEVAAQVIYVADRRRFIPQMKFRLVVEEDNDDVIQLLDNDTTLLREFYGDYYVSELSRHPDPWRQLVIADTAEDARVAAVACLNERIDLELLNDRFELAAFDGLRAKRTVKFAPSLDDSEEDEKEEEYEEDYPFRVYNVDSQTRRLINTNDAGIEYKHVYNSDDEERSSISSARGDAFALELLGFRRDDAPMLQASGRQLLGAVFECFPRLRYCVVLVPTARQHFPFLDYFTRVPLKADKDFPMSLYVVHRASVHGQLQVRQSRYDRDHEAITHLLKHSQNLLADFNATPKDDSRRRYVFTCDNVVAGIAIVCDEEKREVDRLVDCYRVEDLLDSRRGSALRLLGLALAPIFQPSSGFFLGEIVRLEASDAMFFRKIEAATPSCLSAMQAVEPRMRNWPQFQRVHDREYEDSPFEELFELYVASPRLVTMSKQIVNVKVVVVGASDCGLALVDALASGYKHRDLQFADITLISTNGLPYEHSDDYSVRTMIPFRGRYCRTYRSLTSARMNCNVVKGTVVGIDRKKQLVYVEDSGALSYDYLILTCGLLFQRPEFDENTNHTDDGTLEVPSNYFTINDDVEAAKCLKEIKRLTKNFKVEKSIVFHGCNVECYCAIAAFLESGLEGSWITLIEPSDDIFIGDLQIRDQLREIISELGVRLLSGRDLADWKLDSSSRRVESLVLRRRENNDKDDEAEGPSIMLVTCDAILGFHRKSPCLKTFLAISRAGLVFDGRLVVDAEFRTNDRRVFAAGTMTKYSRRLRADDQEHKYFDSLQVGEKLAEKFVSIIIADSDVEAPSSEKYEVKELPEFTGPIIVSCLLPGGYRYLHVRKPGPRPLDDDDDQAQQRDDVLTTGSCTSDTGYFRLRLNQFGALECVTCFGKTDYNIQNVIALYGKHESLFDDLRTRFSNGEIPDFYAYFREPWATALFADDFDDSCLTRKLSGYHAISDEIDTEETLFREVLNALKSSKMTAKDLPSEIAFTSEVRDRLIAYLERHEDELPMYSTPEKLRRIRGEIADTPLLVADPDNVCESSPSNEDEATHVLESDSSCCCSDGSDSEIVLT